MCHRLGKALHGIESRRAAALGTGVAPEMTDAREREERPRWPAPGPAGGDAPAAALFATLHLRKLKSPAAPVGPSGIGDYSSSES